MQRKILSFILAGGKGERLLPLTKDRAKPAVPFGGIYRIIDFTLSNCVNSGLRKVHVLPQYKSISLFRHLELGWNIFNRGMGEFIDLLPAQMRGTDTFYRGTADAVYQNIYSIEQENPSHILILAGDHIYKMDYNKMIAYHEEKNADLTIGAIEVPQEKAAHLGIMQVDTDNRIISFQEKPSSPPTLPGRMDACLASMGIYLFNAKILEERLHEDAIRQSSHDFGRDIIPSMISGDRVYAYPFFDENRKEVAYWRDIGTLDAYWEANMDLVDVTPVLNLYDRRWPLHTYYEQYPPAKTVFAQEYKRGRLGRALDSLISPGCIISGARVERSILSPAVHVHSYAEIKESVIMERTEIARQARVKRAVIDKDVFIGEGVEIGYNIEEDKKRFLVTPQGIVVISKGMRIEK